MRRTIDWLTLRRSAANILRSHLAGTATSLRDALHAHIFLLAQSDGTLVWHHHPARDSPWFVLRVHDLVEKVDAFVQRCNRSSRPFAPPATADSILQKIV